MGCINMATALIWTTQYAIKPILIQEQAVLIQRQINTATACINTAAILIWAAPY